MDKQEFILSGVKFFEGIVRIVATKLPESTQIGEAKRTQEWIQETYGVSQRTVTNKLSAAGIKHCGTNKNRERLYWESDIKKAFE